MQFRFHALVSLLLIMLCGITYAAISQNIDPAELRSGKSFIPTQTFTESDDQRILALFKGLRVADVSDGMDAVGLHNTGLMDSDIRPLWKDTQKFTHRFIGFAVTARYVPTQRPPAGKMKVDDYDKWAGEWYSKLSPEPFVPILRKASALVIEDSSRVDVGSIGSNNLMGWKLKGCVGVVTSATARDTDEITTQGIPLYFQKPGRGIRPGRNEIESVNKPIVCGGVLVKPGDVIEVCGYPPKETTIWQIAGPTSATSLAGRLITAELIVLPDGKVQEWEDYGFHHCFPPGYRDRHSK